MIHPESQFAQYQRAYEVLGVPVSSSAASIKRAYRQFTKRWHPDLYRSGSPEYVNAVEMMKLVNESYAEIKCAPLRYYTPLRPSPTSFPATSWETKNNQKLEARIEFWTRFIFGALLGIFLAFGLMIRWYREPRALVLASIALVIGCGWAAARLGDDFWFTVFSRRF